MPNTKRSDIPRKNRVSRVTERKNVAERLTDRKRLYSSLGAYKSSLALYQVGCTIWLLVRRRYGVQDTRKTLIIAPSNTRLGGGCKRRVRNTVKQKFW